MNWLKNHVGTGLIVLGVALFTALHLLRLTFVNELLFLPLLFIVVGILLHVRAMKRESKY